MLNLKRTELLVTAILLLWLIALLMLPSNPLDHVPGQDNGVFLYGGQQLLSGKTPYLDFWDHKGPLIYLINAFGLLMGNGLRWGVWLVEFAFLVLTALGMYRIGARVWGPPVALVSLGAWAFGILQVGSYHHFRDSNYTETYNLLFGVWAVVFWLMAQEASANHRYYFLIGLMAGLSFMLRPNNIGVPVTIAIVEVIQAIRERRILGAIRRIAPILAGGISILVVFSAWFYVRGAFLHFYDALITYNLIYSRKENLYSIFTIFQRVSSMLSWLPLVGYLLVVGSLMWTRRSGSQPSGTLNRFVLFLLVGWPLEVILSSISGRFLIHYFITWTPFVGWLAGAGLVAVFPSLPAQVGKRYVSTAVFGFLAILVIFSIPAFNQARDLFVHLVYDRGQGVEAGSAIVRYTESHTRETDRVLVWGTDVWINFLSRRESPSQYSFQSPLFLPGYTDREKIMDFLNDIREHRPPIIIEPVVDTDSIAPLDEARRANVPDRLYVPPEFSLVLEYIASNYCVETILNDIIIYRLKSHPEGSPCP